MDLWANSLLMSETPKHQLRAKRLREKVKDWCYVYSRKKLLCKLFPLEQSPFDRWDQRGDIHTALLSMEVEEWWCVHLDLCVLKISVIKCEAISPSDQPDPNTYTSDNWRKRPHRLSGGRSRLLCCFMEVTLLVCRMPPHCLCRSIRLFWVIPFILRWNSRGSLSRSMVRRV